LTYAAALRIAQEIERGTKNLKVMRHPGTEAGEGSLEMGYVIAVEIQTLG
jgi:hypothetical protein